LNIDLVQADLLRYLTFDRHSNKPSKGRMLQRRRRISSSSWLGAPFQRGK
jgi:hypothetical protein